MIRHYLWAGLDFMMDADGVPVLLDANRASHGLWEYGRIYGDKRPFEIVAGVMNALAGPHCLLWRRADNPPLVEENAVLIGTWLLRHLDRPPHICNVEDNEHASDVLRTREGEFVRPAGVFRWWYGLPWSFERSGVLVINPNCLWVTVRDKLRLYEALASGPRHFRVPVSVGVQSAEEAKQYLADRPRDFASGFVLKPRVGWGGYDVQVGDPGDQPRAFSGDYVLCERIVPHRPDGRYWDARAFVMAGTFVGAIRYSNTAPVTNYHQGGEPGALDDAANEAVGRAALEAVARIDQLAHDVHELVTPPASALVAVQY